MAKRTGARFWALLLTVVVGVGAGACSLSGDEDTQATATTAAVATVTPTPPIAAATFTPAPTATATPTPQASATPTATTPRSRPTPTAVVLPSGGAELTIFGRAVSQVVAAGDDGTVLYAVAGTRVARSPDGGATWFAQGRAVAGTLVPAFGDPDLLYAGELGSCAMSVREYPLTVSDDGGRTWEEVPESQGIKPLLVEATDPPVLIASRCPLVLSLDGGATWSFIPATANFDVRTAVAHAGTVFGEVAVIGTSEGGTSVLWVFDFTNPEAIVELGEKATFWGLGGLAWQGERLVLATATGVGVSTDAGDSWTWSRVGLEDATYSVDPLTEEIPPDELGIAIGLHLAAVDPEDPDRIWVAGRAGLFGSTDGGATWERWGSLTDVTGLTVSATSDRVFAVSEGQTYVWTRSGE